MLPNVVHTNLMNKKTGQNMVLIILQGVFGLIWYLLSLVNSLVLKIISDSIVAVASNSHHNLPNGTKFHGDWCRDWWDNHYSVCTTAFYSRKLAKSWYRLMPQVRLMQLPSSDFKALSNGISTSKIGPAADEILPIWWLIWEHFGRFRCSSAFMCMFEGR